ncbi:hypothetical protein TNCV_2627381 [Trichonephila clavipes]|uniref:Secreted protein n=1 Tax=Trichonephila clavipes TaxID=2585209 RepID=A0A8X7BFS5_TRICX|nr:hypothetical protein TNCV_2627381 [Trichonephila clavipes]
MSGFLTGTRLCIPILCNSLLMAAAEICWEKPWLTFVEAQYGPCSAIQFIRDDDDHALGELCSNHSYEF